MKLKSENLDEIDIEKCTYEAPAAFVCECLKRKELRVCVCVCVCVCMCECVCVRERESNALIIVLLWNVSFISHNHFGRSSGRGSAKSRLVRNLLFVICIRGNSNSNSEAHLFR